MMTTVMENQPNSVECKSAEVLLEKDYRFPVNANCTHTKDRIKSTLLPSCGQKGVFPYDYHAMTI